jgi:hypothetical protein
MNRGLTPPFQLFSFPNYRKSTPVSTFPFYARGPDDMNENIHGVWNIRKVIATLMEDLHLILNDYSASGE